MAAQNGVDGGGLNPSSVPAETDGLRVRILREDAYVEACFVGVIRMPIPPVCVLGAAQTDKEGRQPNFKNKKPYNPFHKTQSSKPVKVTKVVTRNLNKVIDRTERPWNRALLL